MGRGTWHREAMHQAPRGHRSSDTWRVSSVTLEKEGETGMREMRIIFFNARYISTFDVRISYIYISLENIRRRDAYKFIIRKLHTHCF